MIQSILLSTHSTRSLLSIVAVALSLFACSSGSSKPAGNANYEGTWTTDCSSPNGGFSALYGAYFQRYFIYDGSRAVFGAKGFDDSQCLADSGKGFTISGSIELGEVYTESTFGAQAQIITFSSDDSGVGIVVQPYNDIMYQTENYVLLGDGDTEDANTGAPTALDAGNRYINRGVADFTIIFN